MREAYAVDFESYYDDEVSIKTIGTWHYLRHPKQDIYLVAIHGPRGTYCGRPEGFDWDSIKDDVWISSNAAFDTLVYERLKELFPEKSWPNPPEWHCAADLAAYLGHGRAVKEYAKTLLGREVSKDYRNVMKGRYFQDITPAEQQQVIDAAISDAQVAYDAWVGHSDKWPEHERQLSLLTRQMGWRGVHVDMDALLEAKRVLDICLWTARTSIPWADEKDEKGKDIKLLSMKRLALMCREVGIEPPANMSKDKPEFDEWLDKYDSQYPWARAMSEYRRINTALERINTMITRTRPDGRMGYGLKYAGAHTLRWSGDEGQNMQNLPKAPVYISKEHLVIRDYDKLEEIGKMEEAGKDHPDVSAAIDFRGLITAPPGKEFHIVDLSQIEPRCLWWLTDDQESMQLAASGMSPYEVHARKSMGWAGGDLKAAAKSDPVAKKIYALAKARVLALGYGAGWHKFYGMALTYGVSPKMFDDAVSPETVAEFERYLDMVASMGNQNQLEVYRAADPAHKMRYTNAWLIVNDFRKTNPKLCRKPERPDRSDAGLWESLEDAMMRRRGRAFEIELPSGRVLKYRKVNTSGGLTAEVVKNGRISRQHFYGGKLTENLVQAVARDVFAEAKLRVAAAGKTPVLSVHDELVVEEPEGTPTDELLSLMTVTPSWLPGCPIAAEAQVSKRYLK